MNDVIEDMMALEFEQGTKILGNPWGACHFNYTINEKLKKLKMLIIYYRKK